MKNDRELLELAAKAIGISDYKVVKTIGGHEALSFVGRSAIPWQPLIDDADALRLAVKLGICIAPGSNTLTHRSKFAVATGDSGEILEVRGDDPYTATRRAIVRAAAEIGKTK